MHDAGVIFQLKFGKNNGTNRSLFRGEVISVCVVTNEKLNGSGINNSRQRRNEQSEKARIINGSDLFSLCPFVLHHIC